MEKPREDPKGPTIENPKGPEVKDPKKIVEEKLKENKKSKIENIDEYEKEKIERTLKDAEHLVAVIKNYLEMVKFCDEQGIHIKKRKSFDRLRYPNGPAGPDSDLGKIARMFEGGQIEIGRYLTKEQLDEIYHERIEPNEQK